MQPYSPAAIHPGTYPLRTPSATSVVSAFAIVAVLLSTLFMARLPAAIGGSLSGVIGYTSGGDLRSAGQALSGSPQSAVVPPSALTAISARLGRGDAAYHAAVSGESAQFTNARQALSASVEPNGARLSAVGRDLGLGAIGVGRGARPADLPAGSLSVDANRAELARGGVVEWYVNGPSGLQQGFTLASAPAGDFTAPVTIALALGSGLSVGIDADGRGLTVLDSTGATVARYSGLLAFDAAGRTLPAWLSAADGLAIQVRDNGAVYPITVDPLIQAGVLTASGGTAGDYLGFSVAVSGDTIVVGAPHRTVVNSMQGAAYVFVRGPAGWGNSTETATLTASDGAMNDSFGSSVAISADTIVVGTPQDAIGSEIDQGSAYVFVRPPAGWSTMIETAKLTASDGVGGDNLGWSVAIDGDTAVIGAPNNTGIGSNQAAYVYVRSGGGWSTMTQTAKLTSSDGAVGDFVGGSVAISGDTVVVGAPLHSISVDAQEGAAYVFVRPVGGWGTATPAEVRLTASDGAVGSNLGWSVAISADTVVAGSPGVGKGAAYVFVRPGANWATTSAFTAKLTTTDGANGDNFGLSVAVDGNTAVVGAPYSDAGVSANQGAAYAYVRPQTGWATTSVYTTKLLASDSAAGDNFGAAVSTSGGAIVVGAYLHDVGSSNADQGAAYVFANQTGPRTVYLPIVLRGS